MLAVGCSLGFPMNSPEDSAANDPASSDLDLNSASFSDVNEAGFLNASHQIQTSTEYGGKMLTVGCSLNSPIDSPEASATQRDGSDTPTDQMLARERIAGPRETYSVRDLHIPIL